MRVEDMAFSPPTWVEIDAQTNATVTVTRAASPGNAHYIDEIHCSVDRVSAADGILTLKSGATVVRAWRIPTGFLGPLVMFLQRPIRIAEGAAAELSMGGLGASVVTNLTMAGKTGR